MLLRNVLPAACALFGVTAAAQAATFDLSGSIGAAPPFSVTSAGLTATFTSPDGNGFQVQETTGLLTFSTALLDNDFFGTDPLTITFSNPVVDQIRIPFAILDAFNTGDTLNVTTDSGQSLTFDTSPDGLTLQEPEGVVDFVPGAPIRSLTLTSPIAFAVGSVDVPEPTSLALLATGLVALAARRRGRAGSLKTPG